VSTIDRTEDGTAGYTAYGSFHMPALAAFSEPFVKINRKQQFSAKSFLAIAGAGRAIRRHPKGEVIFSQADPANALFYIRKGKVKLTVISSRGKQAVIAILGVGDFFGEGCLAGQLIRMSSAAALVECSLMQLEKAAALAVIHEEPAFSGLFLQYVLSRNIRIEEDLVDQLFNSSEKRLARALLLLAHFGKPGKPEPVIPPMSQETLAQIVGTTRSRVSFFMNRFRKRGFIDYKNGLEVHNSLLKVLLSD
jgi:CRP/FNR family transcriptional regulator, cyclic AMP receptor protein